METDLSAAGIANNFITDPIMDGISERMLWLLSILSNIITGAST